MEPTRGMISDHEAHGAGRKTTQDHWESAHSAAPVRMRLPSPLNVATLNFMRLLRRYVQPGMRVLEVGCAPGKYLSWIAKVLKGEVAGVDYSHAGIGTVHALFTALGIKGDLRCED